MKKIIVFDNYDSFTYNLVHLLETIGGCSIQVHRNDKISLEQIKDFDKIVLSPGPGIPSEAGILIPLIKTYSSTKSILGVCLGHQAIAEAFGAKLINLETVFHGVATPTMIIKEDKLFKDIPKKFLTGRYHSWVVSPTDFPECLEITAIDEHQNIMALRHKTADVCGVQFHPESIMTEYGEQLIRNWVSS